jgi:hypothetical protein
MKVRGRVLVPVALLAVLLAGCGSWRSMGSGHACTVGDMDPMNPIVCIDNTGTTLKAYPETIEVFDRQVDQKPVKILFFTRTGTGNPKIKPQGDCLEKVDHPVGRAIGHVKKLGDTTSGDKRCKYDIELSGFEPLDPFIIVKPCCSLIGGTE